MPRPKNSQCHRCAAQSAEWAQQQPCWSSKTCRAKRYYYKHRPANLAKKRTRQRGQKVTELDIPLYGYVLPPEIVMTFFRDRADGPIHALEFTVIENGEAISKVTPIHLKGVPQTKLRSHIKNVLALLKAQFGQELTVCQARQPVNMCPLCHQDGHADD